MDETCQGRVFCHCCRSGENDSSAGQHAGKGQHSQLLQQVCLRKDTANTVWNTASSCVLGKTKLHWNFEKNGKKYVRLVMDVCVLLEKYPKHIIERLEFSWIIFTVR